MGGNGWITLLLVNNKGLSGTALVTPDLLNITSIPENEQYKLYASSIYVHSQATVSYICLLWATTKNPLMI